MVISRVCLIIENIYGLIGTDSGAILKTFGLVDSELVCDRLQDSENDRCYRFGKPAGAPCAEPSAPKDERFGVWQTLERFSFSYAILLKRGKFCCCNRVYAIFIARH